MKRNLLALTCITAILATAATAQDGRIRANCAADISLYCGEVTQIRGAVRLCLDQHLSLVALTCREALETAGSRQMRQQWLSPDGTALLGLRQVITTLTDQGYSAFTEIEFENGRYEIEATDANGRRVEVYVDAATGVILKSEPES